MNARHGRSAGLLDLRTGCPGAAGLPARAGRELGAVRLAAALAAVFVAHIARFEATAPSRPTAETTAPVSDQVV
jgi:hypothetical protein